MTKKLDGRIKRAENGRAMLNLGCGYKMHRDWTNLDFSLYARLAHHKKIGRLLRKLGILSEERYQRLLGVDPDIIIWDLRRGIPFSDAAFDAVYHSHLLEHLDRDSAPLLLTECRRVLRSGGIIRMAVPDLRFLIDRYNSAVSKLERGDEMASNEHQQAITGLFDQMVRRQLTGPGGQSAFMLAAERLLRGDTAKTGCLHRWMYDKHSLEALMKTVGFKDIRQRGVYESGIEGWRRFNLDNRDDGTAYKPESIYMEGVK